MLSSTNTSLLSVDKLVEKHVHFSRASFVTFFPQIYSYISEIFFDGKSSIGTGESFHYSAAQWCSLGEAIERYYLLHRSLVWCDGNGNRSGPYRPSSSNGVAFHSDLERACRSAILERYERHTVLKAWLEYTEVMELRQTSPLPFLAMLNGVKWGRKVQFLWFPNKRAYIVACVISGERKPFSVFGFGASEREPKVAIEKALFEALRFLWSTPSGNADGVSSTRSEFSNCLKHYEFYANRPVQLEKVFQVSARTTYGELKRSLQPAQVKKSLGTDGKIYLLDDPCKFVEGHLAWFTSSDLIDIWFGPLTSARGNRIAGEIHPIA